jgi:exosortase A
MTTETMAPSIRGQIHRSFRLVSPVVAVGLLSFGVLFHTEVINAVGVWSDSTAYNHCFLVIPIVAYLLWERRDRLVQATPLPNPWFALAAIPVGVIWLLAERLGIMEGRQLMMMTLVEIFFLSVLGWRLYYLMLGPLLYLYFLVPFGAFLTPTLQGFTTSFIVHGLNLLNIPNYADGNSIEIPEGSFLVAEACAGLRFLIASIAFGCLYAMLMYRTPLRRGVFIVVSIIVPIIANGFRALGIVVVGHIIGNAQAAVADHLIYGWVFFSVVILLQIALGLPFRQDHQTPLSAEHAIVGSHLGRQTSPRPAARWRTLSVALWSGSLLRAELGDSPATLRGLASAAMVVIVIAAIGPATAMTLNRLATANFAATLKPIEFTGACTTDPARPTEQQDNAGRLWLEYLKCGQVAFALRLELFSPRASPSDVIAGLRALSGGPPGETTTVFFLSSVADPRTWRVQEFNDPARTVAASLWINGHPTQVSFDMRMARAWASIAGSRYAPVAISLTPELDWSQPSVALRNRARDMIAQFVQTYPSLSDQISELSDTATH